jgi:hypothetical protein
VFKNETKRASAIKGLAAAVSLAALGFAGQAFATEANPTGQYIKLEGSSMVQTYTALVGTTSGNAVNAYSNGVTFSYQNSTAGGVVNGQVYTLYGFCIDVAHEMSLGNLSLVYKDTFNVNTPGASQVPTALFANPALNTATTQSALTKLIDTGWLLHESETGKSAAYVANADLQLAAIQAAIWKTEGAYVSINNGSATAGANIGGAINGLPAPTGPGDLNTTWSYSDYFSYYSSGNFLNLGDANDKFYTILDTATNPAHQGFAIGWPVPNGVPEPATWAMMITGFFGMGAALRNRRKPAVAAI